MRSLLHYTNKYPSIFTTLAFVFIEMNSIVVITNGSVCLHRQTDRQTDPPIFVPVHRCFHYLHADVPTYQPTDPHARHASPKETQDSSTPS